MRVPYPTVNVEVAQNFFVDCEDLLQRYDDTIDRFYCIKTRRLKCFHDLRSAYECALKCVMAYHQHTETEREVLIDRVERTGHRISLLEAKAQHLAGPGKYQLQAWGEILDQLPVSLRYALDGYDFLSAKESLYYDTIGSDSWLNSLRAYLSKVFEALDIQLSKHSGVLSASDIPRDALLGKTFNKYRKA